MNESISPRALATLTKPCAVEGCDKLTGKRKYFCRAHQYAYEFNGHPEAKALLRKHYLPELNEVSALLHNHSTNISVQTILARVNAWMFEASEYQSFSGMNEVKRLLQADVTSLELLSECLAVYTYATRNPELYPYDDVLTYQLTNAVLRLAHRPKVESDKGIVYTSSCSIKARRDIGFHLRSILDPFYKLITHGVPEPMPKPKTFFSRLLDSAKGFTYRRGLANV